MIRRTWHFIIIGVMILSAENCKKQEDAIIKPKDIQGKLWLHSYEEDSANYKAYRPDEFNFPPSRGRAGFKVENDSIFVKYAIAPTDGWKKEYGKYEVKDNKIRITFDEKNNKDLVYEIIKGSPDFLLINEIRQ